MSAKFRTVFICVILIFPYYVKSSSYEVKTEGLNRRVSNLEFY